MKPIKQVRDESISISIFENGVSIQKSYKDKEGKWVNKNLNLFKSELKNLQNCLDKLKDD